MSERNRFLANWLLAGLAIAGLLAAYVGGYYCLGTSVEMIPIDERKFYRTYPYEWEVLVFRPFSKVETWMTGREVTVTFPIES